MTDVVTETVAQQPAPVRLQDDLYHHVNGQWIAAAEIPADKPIHGAFLELRDDAEAACRQIIDAAAGSSGEAGTPTQLIGDLYASFMDSAAIEEAGLSILTDQLAAVDEVDSVVGLARMLGRLTREGASGAFGMAIDNDADDPNRYLPHLYQGGLGLPDESYYSDEQYEEIRRAYVAHLARMLTLADRPAAETGAAQVLALETELAAAHWDRVKSRNRTLTHNPKDRAGLDEMLPAQVWDAYLEGLGAPAGLLAEADVMQPDYFTALAGLLSPQRLPQWRHWLAVRVIRSAAPYGPDALVAEHFDFYGRTLSGTPELRERWKRGVALVEGAVGEALGEAYVAQHFRPEAKARMDELVDHLVAAYRRNISALPWMTEVTRERALEKLAAFTPKIGYPVRFRDYAELRIDRRDLIGNVRRSNAADWDRELAKVGRPVDRDEWFMTPQTVNAYYNPGFNEVVFPAAILQPPFFDLAADEATNYGGIGAVIGHEIGHGFDDQGSKYDGTGALRDWWTAADREAFEALTARLIEQYNALSPDGADGQHVNGALTIGENIGDLGGLGIAYQAWLLSAGELTEAERIAGAQRLFLNWARVWRTKTRPAEVQRRLSIDPHSPPEFRCNQVVRNLDEFYEAFGVTETDELWLDPAERVRIW